MNQGRRIGGLGVEVLMRYPLPLAMLYAVMTTLLVLSLGLDWGAHTRPGVLMLGGGYVVLSTGLWWWLLQSEYRRFEQRQAQLINDAVHDALTQLTNRRAFLDNLDTAIYRSRRNNTRLGLAFIDLDGFKMVNDIYGHGAGDLLLIAVAQRLTETVRKGDMVARVGGDEFVVLVEPDKGESCEILAQRLIQAFQAPFDLDGHKVNISLSIGVAFCPEHADEAGQLLTAADLAMYRVKKNGRNGYAVANKEESHRSTGAMPLQAAR
ncbi:GGDEF domain-containing protein [Paludibacterium purpuratum]|uniref:Diguanylate cyclase (GGDEF)-like protein n=1 Tax=Paludibacterium purpuratum TaxID=1144873 RepID=A0A4R7B209_9NEIS|nr:GGDEF domain-containing protein [Paludibacterium purpuratum]TDR73863.1 diguanylate cyclase (GGDEF)-like protein [Paludibacterium purpuratum]